MKTQCKSFSEEIVTYVFNPLRIQRMYELFELDMEEYLEML
jgi:hypothetical protein